MAADSRFAIASAAPGFDLPFTPLYPPWSASACVPKSTSFGASAFSPFIAILACSISTGEFDHSLSCLTPLPLLPPPRVSLRGSPRSVRPPRDEPCRGPVLSSSFGLGPPPRRTASGDAYSTTRFRPSKRWFLGLMRAAVECSMLVKSTNAHLYQI